ncbi:hypothetical protein BKA70DRAFT_1300783 [Coprinopsis sp. MPI-PUGE-AT-0042]|nr:hypothetical protein BKA70DRAFT_1300783 [Coprinopsis sp. MPI-PUGE-AT-0042]
MDVKCVGRFGQDGHFVASRIPPILLVIVTWLLFLIFALLQPSACHPSSSSLLKPSVGIFLRSSRSTWLISPEGPGKRGVGIEGTIVPPQWMKWGPGSLVLLQRRRWCYVMALEVKTKGEVAGWRETMNSREREDRRSEISSEAGATTISTLSRRSLTRTSVFSFRQTFEGSPCMICQLPVAHPGGSCQSRHPGREQEFEFI